MPIKKITPCFSLCLMVCMVMIFASCKRHDAATSALKLWYCQPAEAAATDDTHGWQDDPQLLNALPLGNGALGAMVFGDVNRERIQLNEESMWSGSPQQSDNAEAYAAQATIRALLFQRRYREASELTARTQICKGQGSGHGKGAAVPFGSFQTLGDLWIDFHNKSSYKDYHRELDLEEAVARVQYTQDGVEYKREIFVSQPDQMMVVRLTANRPGMISFTSSLTRPERYETVAGDDQLIMHGALSDGRGGDGLRYMVRLAAVNENGTVRYTDAGVVVEDADEVTLLLTASTDYMLEYPDYCGRDYEQTTASRLLQGRLKPYEELFNRHKGDYQTYFNRVDLKLTSRLSDTVPTDVRLQRFRETESDLHLAELMFQYGRYLLISSSRPGTLPANLQGIWTNKIQTPWNGDYHTDVNVQMNYWLAETTNLGEMHLPLFDLMRSIQKPGAKTAKIHYNAEGWVLHPITNVWGFTSPGEVSSWGMHVGAGAWLATHIMEHYYFTLDKDFLEETFPMLKASTRFYLDWLTADPATGELLSGPSVSPENTFLAPDGSWSQICMGPAHDQQVIWQLFKNHIDASQALDINDDFLATVTTAQEQLAKPKIASDGRLMEWHQEFEEAEPGHRHISHLFAVHPGYQIDRYKTPNLAAAAKRSLDYRIQNGGGHTGWSAAWLINQYARLGDGENAWQSLKTVLTKSTAPNLFGLHPPFQIDGNFGTTAGIAEMLMQSHAEDIRLLPALPQEWETGEVKGLCARGGFVIDMKWEQGELTHVRVYSKNGGVCKLSYRDEEVTLDILAGMECFPMREGNNFEFGNL